MSAAEATTGWKTIQRVILPSADQTDTMPLYVDAGTASGIRLRENDELARTPKHPEEKLQMFSSGGREAHFEDLLTRHSMRVRSGEQISFGTYFNAFPASYWRRWTSVRDIRLTVKTSGTGTVTVYKSNARGSVQRVDGKRVDGDSTSTFELPLKPFGDG
ncbi:MAG: glycosyltransferase family 2 protein, partial [Arthrobacter sp.]|nr:glycosyltransferase family 2 protein [Arthrobacter sp.]